MILRFTLIVALFIHGSLLFAQKQKFYSLGTEDGIISSHVDYVFVDSYGYLWLAAYDGVQRWDGITGYNYHYNKTNPQSLSNNISNTIFEDSNKDVWIGTINGLCKFDRKSGQIQRIFLSDKNTPVNAIIQQKKNALWIGTSNGLCELDTKTLKVNWPNKTLAALSIFALALDNQQNVWVGTYENGVYQVDHKNQIIKQFSSNTTPAIVSNKVRTLRVDSKNNIWIGTMNKGISVINLTNNSHFEIQHFGNKKTPKGGFDEIRAIYEDKTKNVWVGALNQPLYRFDPNSKQLIEQKTNSENHAEKSAISIFSITEDKFGNMWLGTHGMGLFYTNTHKNKIIQVGGKSQISNTNSHLITSIAVDDAGNTWAGTDGGGLLKTNKQGITTILSTKDGLSSNAIHHISKDKNGILWLSTWGGGIMSLNPTNMQMHAYTHQSHNHFSLIGDNSKVTLPDDSIVWIGTHGDGIAILDKKSGKIYNHLNNNNHFPYKLSEPAWINHIFKDSQNRIWVSTCFGLYLIKNNTMLSFHANDKKSKLANDYVNMVAEDQQGKIWLVGEEGGLQYYDESHSQFIQINNSSIPSCIKSIVIDQQNNTWLGTNIGIILFHPIKNTLTVFNQNNGFQGPHFFHKANYYDTHGYLYFGGMNGYNKFKSDDVQFHEQDLQLRFENVHLQGEAPDTIVPLNESQALEIPFQYRVASLSFSIPDQFAAQNLKVAYQIEGLNNAWIPLENGSRKISLTGLSPDRYLVSIKYSIDGNEWKAFKNKLVINILPPWWKTIWFRTFILVLIIIATFLFYRIRTASIRKRNLLLKDLVRERTAELLESNVSLLEKNDETMNQNEQLEQLNLEYKKQAYTIIQHQNTILAQNRDLNRIIEHASLQDNGEIKNILSSLKENENPEPQQEIWVKVALYKIQRQQEIETSLANIALMANCQTEEELLEYLPDFILIDEQFDGNINSLLSHIPIIRIIGKDALIRAAHIVADITLTSENISTTLPKQINQYISRRKLINERFVKTEALTNDELTPHSADKEFIDQTIAIIELHLSNSAFDSELLGEELHMSRTVLYSKIKQLTGMGVHEYIKMIRVKKSIDLLKERKLNVSQIAYEVGFSSPSYYIRCFVKQFGMPPKEYMSQKA